jgi:UDP-N-acetyl-D-glucosamine dehydrogenase
MEKLEVKGALVDYNDPFVPVVKPTRKHSQFIGKKSAEIKKGYDLILISTAHDVYKNIDLLSLNIPIVDTRNLIKSTSSLLNKA